MKKASQKQTSAGQALRLVPWRSTIASPASEKRIASVSTRARPAQVVTNQGRAKRLAEDGGGGTVRDERPQPSVERDHHSERRREAEQAREGERRPEQLLAESDDPDEDRRVVGDEEGVVGEIRKVAAPLGEELRHPEHAALTVVAAPRRAHGQERLSPERPQAVGEDRRQQDRGEAAQRGPTSSRRACG